MKKVLGFLMIAVFCSVMAGEGIAYDMGYWIKVTTSATNSVVSYLTNDPLTNQSLANDSWGIKSHLNAIATGPAVSNAQILVSPEATAAYFEIEDSLNTTVSTGTDGFAYVELSDGHPDNSIQSPAAFSYSNIAVTVSYPGFETFSFNLPSSAIPNYLYTPGDINTIQYIGIDVRLKRSLYMRSAPAKLAPQMREVPKIRRPGSSKTTSTTLRFPRDMESPFRSF
jgi:hypothetical protein